ncbi:TonB-dependent receptor [Halieaceae bacterium IMCC14734]|uniref:TonB-dependent receptor n=1 Tax=Candidatus Litorirhabdus singularis TaxID=2518993 RepID=A0ABT3TG15_9GAMM|nr:TonB-dependent receptor [Candidatus Litorirhabdus singularis]MCX2981250.1 TonB-dependent receptor [Candidatus Litorirhabdus singularis]
MTAIQLLPLTLLTAALSGTVLPACAQTGDGLETVNVVGTRLDLSPSEMSGQISVVDATEIAARNKDRLEALLQSLPGVSINQQGGAGGVSSLYVRGGEANFTIVLIDGVQVNNPVNTRGGSFDFSTIDVSTVTRIELIRGPQSAIYGADALSGALNLITRPPGDGPTASLRAEIGADGYSRGTGTLAAGTAERGIVVSAGTHDSGEPVPGSRQQIDFFNTRFNYSLSQDWHLSGALRYSDSERTSFPEDSGGPELAVWRDLDEAASESASTQFKLSGQLLDNWRSELTFNWFGFDGEEMSPGIAPGSNIPPTGSDTDFDRYQLNWNNNLSWERTRLSFGLDGRREEGDSQGYVDFGILIPADFSLERDTLGAFVEVQHDITAALSVSLGARYDDPDAISSETTARVGAVWRINDGNTVWRANWGQGFKPPSFFALAHPLVGNADLKSETAESWDIGVEHRFANALSINLAVFESRFDDLIDFDDATFTNINRDRVDSRGLELGLQLPLTERGRVVAHATYLDIDIQDSDDQLRGRPEYKAGATAFYELTERVSGSLEYLWVDSVVESSLHTGDSLDYQLDAYNTLDLSLAWQAQEQVRVEFSITNLLDEDYQQAVGFPAPGIAPRIALQVSL